MYEAPPIDGAGASITFEDMSMEGDSKAMSNIRGCYESNYNSIGKDIQCALEVAMEAHLVNTTKRQHSQQEQVRNG